MNQLEKQSKLRTGERGSLGHSATDAPGLRDVAARGGTAGSGQRRQAALGACSALSRPVCWARLQVAGLASAVWRVRRRGRSSRVSRPRRLRAGPASAPGLGSRWFDPGESRVVGYALPLPRTPGSPLLPLPSPAAELHFLPTCRQGGRMQVDGVCRRRAAPRTELGAHVVPAQWRWL